MENDVVVHKQPGCWLRSSHTFKECVIAHWSSETARKITGAKLYTEIVDTEGRSQKSEGRKRVKMIKTYKELDVYQEGYKLLKEIYEITRKYPKEEQYVMLTQIRRQKSESRRQKAEIKNILRRNFLNPPTAIRLLTSV